MKFVSLVCQAVFIPQGGMLDGIADHIALLPCHQAPWAWRLVRRYPGPSGDDSEWALWGGALSAWFVSVFAGIGNTSLHSEHALLAVILLGLWLADDRRTG